MTTKEEFNLATKAFGLMNDKEQALVLIIFSSLIKKSIPVLEAFVSACHKVCVAVSK